MTHTPFAPEHDIQQGTTWHDSKHYYFHPQFIEVRRIWPEPAAWRKVAGGGWRHVLPGQFDLDGYRPGAQRVQAAVDKAARATGVVPDPLTVPAILANSDLRRRVPDWRVVQAIPPPVAACLSGLGGRGWHLLTLLARVPEAIELAQTNRAVAWILASSRDFRPCAQPMRRARRLVRLPRHAMLAELGWPPRKAVVRLLAKVWPKALASVAELLLLRDRCHDPDFLQAAAHLPVVSPDVLRLLADERIAHWATPTLWREVAVRDSVLGQGASSDPPVAHLLALAVERSLDLGVGLPQVTSIRQLTELQADLRAGLARMAAEQGFTDLRFGPPPLVPPRDLPMDALADFGALRDEGDRMHHCIGSPAQRYVRAILAGTAYAWHLPRHEVTVFVEQVQGRWALSEAKGYCNQVPPGWLLRRLHGWLADAQREGADALRQPT